MTSKNEAQLPLPVSNYNTNLEDDANPSRSTSTVIERPFVGRIGGNQAFILSPSDPNYEVKVHSTPDASSKFSWKESFDLNGFRDIELWKQAIMECWATCMLIWITSLIGFALSPDVSAFSTGPLFPSLLGGLVNAIAIPLFIFCAGPVTGGHMNPLITMSTFFGRLSTFPRTILYVIFQILGATIAAYLIRAALGSGLVDSTIIPGCFIDPSIVRPGEALVLETTTSMALIFLAFGIGLDPRQKLVFGPSLGPILIGFALGLATFVTGSVKPGYTGASLNPARCFGLMSAQGRWVYHWVHWVGPIIACIINGLFYWAIPPSK